MNNPKTYFIPPDDHRLVVGNIRDQFTALQIARSEFKGTPCAIVATSNGIRQIWIPNEVKKHEP